MIKVEGHSNLYRDKLTGAIINCDDLGYEQRIKMIKNQKNKEDEMKKIKEDIEEIKDSLSLIIKNLNKP